MSSPFPEQPPAFAPVSHQEWRAAVEKTLGTTPIATLQSHTDDGLVIEPLYSAANVTPGFDGEMPGVAPFTRGPTPFGHGGMGWQLRVAPGAGTIEATNAVILEELRGGAAAVRLDVRDGTEHGARGVHVDSLAELDQLLAGVHLEMATIALDAGGAFLPAAAALTALWSRRATATGERMGELGADPLGALARDGNLPTSVDDALSQLADLAAWTAAEETMHPAVRVSTSTYHAAGCTAAQELAIATATGIAYLRAMEAGGVAPDDAARQIVFDLSIGTEQFQEIAKLRAFRLVWSRVLEVSGVAPSAPRLTAQLAHRVITIRDPWVNMLRGTMACFAAAVGGADAITIHPYDIAGGAPGPLGRRVARNTGLILHEESHVDVPADPAGGSWFVESLTTALAERAWGELQEIERAGGMAAALTSGWIASRIADAHTRRRRDVVRRKRAITGVSEFANLAERPLASHPDMPAAAATARTAGRPERSETNDAEVGERLATVRAASTGDARPRGGARMRAAIAAVESGATFAAVSEALAAGHAPATITPLPIHPLAAPFERLRDASDAWLAANGSRPRAVLVTIGPVAQHAARAGYARNLLEAGGIELFETKPVSTADAAAAAFREHSAGIAVLASSDALYAEHAEAMAAALRAAGARTIVHAGRPGDREAALRTAGVDLFVHVGIDAAAALAELLRREGVL